MDLRFCRILPFAVYLLVYSLVSPGGAWAQSVRALFALETPQSGPFPSDWFTVPDGTHNTGRRVNLPDCTVYLSDCEDLAVINELDGFNLQPRLSIPFDGPLDVESVTSEAVFLISLGSTLDHGGDPPGTVVGINQIVWDPFTNTLHVEADAPLEQHTRYALLITNRLRDTFGHPVEATDEFRRFRHTIRGEYKHALLEALHAARRVDVREDDIVAASVFTTQSVTAVLERIHDQIKAASVEPATFNLGPNGERSVFPLADIKRIIFRRQTGDGPPTFTSAELPLELLRILPIPTVSQVAFGKYASPDYAVHPGEYIPPIGTRTGTPQVQGTNEVFFNVTLPSGSKPANGWPVVIYGLGAVSNKDDHGLEIPAIMAAHGLATLTINIVGGGFGPLGTLTVERTAGAPVTFSSGGRGFDQNGDHVIAANEGAQAAPPRTIIDWRDRAQQIVVDWFQLVRVIEAGLDVDGDSEPDIDASRIYYFGHSFSANVGTALVAIEPKIRAGAFTSFGGALVDNRRLGNNRNAVGSALALRSLLNAPGQTHRDGLQLAPGPLFDDNLPLRNGIPFGVRLADGTQRVIQSPLSNTVRRAMEIQQVVEHLEWAAQSGSTVALAPYLRKHPLPGVPARPLLYMFGKGDQSVPNPAATMVLRAGDLADRAALLRNDLVFAEDPTVRKDPHEFMRHINHANPLVRAIARGAQHEIAIFFASDGETIHPELQRFWETPIVGPLPEELNFIP